MKQKLELVQKAIENFEGLYLNKEYIYPIMTEHDTEGNVCLFYMHNGSRLVCRVDDCEFEEEF